MQKKLISIVIPVFNEAESIHRCYSALLSALEPLSPNYEFEYIFMDNCSQDTSFEIIAKIASQDARVRCMSFSKNFGYQRSIWTGYFHSKGDAAIVFDCDLQDPASMLPEFIKKWEQGFKIIYGIREQRQEGPFMNFLRSSFYSLISSISENDLPQDAGDFMLVDRVILDLLKQVNNPKVYLRGLIFSFGYPRFGIPYSRDARKTGDSKINLKQMAVIGADGIVSQSTTPLRISLFIGLSVIFVSLILLILFLSLKFFESDLPPGFTTLVVLLLVSISLNAIFLGIIGEYISRMYEILLQKPMSLIEKSINLTSDSSKEKN